MKWLSNGKKLKTKQRVIPTEAKRSLPLNNLSNNHTIETNQVEFGNKVTICEEGKDEAEDYYLLGPIEFELDLYPMIVTYHSPFGEAVTGKKIGENFTLDIRGKQIKFTVTAIEKITSSTPKSPKKSFI